MSRKKRAGRGSATAKVILCLFVVLAPVHGAAADFIVNSRADVNDLTPGDGLCVAYLNFVPPFYVFPYCTLRAAVQESNSLAGPDTISLPAGGYFLEKNGFGEDEAVTGDLDILESLTIFGEGPERTVIDGGGLDRIFDIHGTALRVVIKGLALQHGTLLLDPGDSSRGGGAIRNSGVLTLREVRLTDNQVQDDAGVSEGGALYNQGECSLISSSLYANTANQGGAIWNGPGATMRVDGTTVRQNSGMAGGGIVNQGRMYLNNSTVSNNRIAGDETCRGAGIRNSGVLEIIHCTIVANRSDSSGAGLYNEGELTGTNTLFAANEGANCRLSSPVSSLGGNLDSDNSCGLTHETDSAGLDPLLGPLRDNGGPTWTHALLPGSPAIDSGRDLANQGIVHDQRGEVRPQGPGYDIGAVEKRFFAAPPFLAPILL